ncbi:MAG: hypothetical protein ABJK43_17740 [Lentilitoribacter sp.]
MKTVSSILAFAALSASLFAPAISQAQALRPNLMIMVQDNDVDTVPAARQRIMSRVAQAINTQLSAKGHNMYDASTVTQDIVLSPNRREARQALIEVARAVTQPPIDAALLFKLYATAKGGNYSTVKRLNIRIEGDLLNLASGQVIGGFETSAFDRPALPLNCDRDCVLEEVGKHSRVIAQDLADAIDVQLTGYLNAAGTNSAVSGAVTTPSAGSANVAQTVAGNAGANATCTGFPHSYAMSFIGFDGQDSSTIEEFLNSFTCKTQIRALASSNNKLGFWYETTANDTILRRNLRTMLEFMEVKAQVNIAGTQIRISKVPSR